MTFPRLAALTKLMKQRAKMIARKNLDIMGKGGDFDNKEIKDYNFEGNKEIMKSFIEEGKSHRNSIN